MNFPDQRDQIVRHGPSSENQFRCPFFRVKLFLRWVRCLGPQAVPFRRQIVPRDPDLGDNLAQAPEQRFGHHGLHIGPSVPDSLGDIDANFQQAGGALDDPGVIA